MKDPEEATVNSVIHPNPAYPSTSIHHTFDHEENLRGIELCQTAGMSLLDYMAGQALQVIGRSVYVESGEIHLGDVDMLARAAYDLGEAMVKEGAKRNDER